MDNIIKTLCEEFKLRYEQTENTVKLMDEGNTIPFIARYRKEVTGNLDDQLLRELFERLTYLRGLAKRKEEVISSMETLGVLTDELKEKVELAKTMTEVEDIYRPYRPKRKTRASVAKEKGLQPLADRIFAQEKDCPAPIEMAAEFVDEEKGVATAEDALQGAMDIIAETISDDAEIRKELREYLARYAVITATGPNKEDPSGVYSMYYEYTEGVKSIASHRILALDRGESDEVLKVKIEADNATCMNIICNAVVVMGSPCTKTVIAAAQDGFDRLIFPSLERELRNDLTEKAQTSAIKVFGINLRNLLMQAPVKNRVTLGLDPAYRTGCKLAVVDGTGKVLHTSVIYPTPPQNKIEQAKETVKRLIDKYGITLISIGNGTASRESEKFVAETLHEIDKKVEYMVVSEAGASVYSASKLAAEEFPEFDVSLRSAVSIARRLQDPLAELVKIDPKAIGVGQYQHDMPPKELDETLDGVVEDCVNSVGVDLNTASVSLLSRVAGINNSIAKNIVAYREENGSFTNRTQLKKVAKLGPKAFEQCAGFLRIAESKNLLDNTSVHPESYDAANKLLEICGYTPAQVRAGEISALPTAVQQIGKAKLAEQLGIGVLTLDDIVSELMKPGRDPRDELAKPLLKTDVMELKDLKPDMVLDGTVRNVIDFGAFVDIGVHEDGLVHISRICDKYIKHPSEVLKVGDIVKVKVLEVDLKRKRISLTMRF